MNSDFLNRIIHLTETKLGLKPHSIRLSTWEEIIKDRMTKSHISTYEDYWQMLISSGDLQDLIERIVIPETWFFREKQIFHFLSQWLTQSKIPTSVFKVLSLACSTGEEPYSIAMTFFDAGFSRNSFSIDAIDISKEALMKAQMGIYQKNSFRGKDLHYRERYFDRTKEGYVIKQHIKEQVHFYYGNIIDDKIFLYSQLYHIIFCRNLLIYLDREAQMHVLNRIKTLLAPQGILIVGSAETKIARDAGFISPEFLHAYAFKWEPEFSTLTNRKTNSVDRQALQKSISSTLEPKLEPGIRSNSLPQLPSNEDHKKTLIQKAIKLANAGSFEDSMQVCLDFINQYGANPDIYYLIGLLNQAMNHEDKAEEFFQKTVYLKPTHYEALVCLALIYEKRGDFHKAEIFRQRAQKNV